MTHLINYYNNKKEYIGKRFNYLTILDINFYPDEPKFDDRCRAVCQCICGTIKDFPIKDVITNQRYSCGCYNKYIHSRQGKFDRLFNRYEPWEQDPTVLKVYFNNVPLDIFMLVDQSTWFYLSKYIWHYHKSDGYGSTNLEDGTYGVYHRMILECPNNMIRDHINRNRLDNRLSNLRIVSPSANAINRTLNPSSGVVGVSFDKPSGKWRAHINIPNPPEIGGRGQRLVSPRFVNIEDAITWRQEMEKKYYQIEGQTTNYLNYNENAETPIYFPPKKPLQLKRKKNNSDERV